MTTLIQNARIYGTDLYTVGAETPLGYVEGDLLVEDDHIAAILTEPSERLEAAQNIDHRVDATGMWLLPGVIDTHVHFREPGLVAKADIASESMAAAAGGVTTVFDMPNVLPTTTSREALDLKAELFATKSVVNYGLFFGITADNIDEALSLPAQDFCGYKVFLGSSTGGMLMNDPNLLRRLFSATQRVIAVHSESESIIAERLAEMKRLRGDQLPIALHPQIRSREACVKATSEAIALAQETGAQLHICHITTADELQFFPIAAPESTVAARTITAEACVAHLHFTDADYARLGSRIKCNPAIKTDADRAALREAISALHSRVDIVATDHAPHLLSDKEGYVTRAASGMPSVQYSLTTMLDLAADGVVDVCDVVRLMSQAPALRFGISERGFIRPGYKADLVLVRPDSPHTITPGSIRSKCGWSPFEGEERRHRIVGTWVNGRRVYDGETVDTAVRGEKVCYTL